MLPRINLIKGRDADFLLSANDTIISPHIYRHGVWEDHILNVAQLFLSGIEHPWVLDIGANLGAFTVPIAKHIAPHGGVVSSFEPQRIVYYQLCGNIFLNRLDNCYAYQYALGDDEKMIDIPEVDFNQASNVGAYSLKPEYMELEKVHLSGKTHPVQQIQLDNMPPPSPNLTLSLIKIDTEGLELNVLKHGQAFLKQHRYPPILFEAWQTEYYQVQREELMAFLRGLDYDIVQIGGMDYVAQHRSGDRYLELFEQNEHNKTYHMKYRNQQNHEGTGN